MSKGTHNLDFTDILLEKSLLFVCSLILSASNKFFRTLDEVVSLHQGLVVSSVVRINIVMIENRLLLPGIKPLERVVIKIRKVEKVCLYICRIQIVGRLHPNKQRIDGISVLLCHLDILERLLQRSTFRQARYVARCKDRSKREDSAEEKCYFFHLSNYEL